MKKSKAGKDYVQCPDKNCKFISDCDEKGAPVKPVDTGIKCEKCGSGMIIRSSWRGPFLACPAYPKCRNSKSISAEMKEEFKAKGIVLPEPPPRAKKAEAPNVEITEKCFECDSPMMLKPSRFGKGFYLSCSKYPKCKGSMKVTPAMQTKIDEALAAAT